MAIEIPEDYALASVRLKHTNVTRPAAVTFAFDRSAWLGTMVQMADAICLDFDNTIGAAMDNEVTEGPVSLTLGSDDGEYVHIDGFQSYGGALAQSSMPSSVAAIIRKTTNRGGRRGKGRFYLPWVLADADVDDAGTVAPAKVTALQTACTNFWTHMSAGTGAITYPLPLVLLHAPSGPEVDNPTTPGVPTPVTALTVDPIIGSQRRRLGR